MERHKDKNLDSLNKLLRLWIIEMTTTAGSGHPSSSLSSVELMSTLFFRGFLRFDTQNSDNKFNDRIIFSKGHAAPLFYALWAVAGEVAHEELLTLRQFWSRLEGHPTMQFPFTEAATGALGQGLSIGLGMALASRNLDHVDNKTWVLLGDSEMAEGQVWEAMAVARHYACSNLVAIVDVNRLGQRGETMHGHDLNAYEQKAKAFGWHTIVVDGHDVDAISDAYQIAADEKERPTMIIAKTLKGKGVSLIEDKEGWHGKVLSQEELAQAVKELGEIDQSERGSIMMPEQSEIVMEDKKSTDSKEKTAKEHTIGELYAVRDAYGDGLVDAMTYDQRVVVLDAEVGNSTRADRARDAFPERFFEMYIAEQNMASVAVGFARRGYLPYISSFAAFLARAHGQIRMARFSEAQMVVAGTHPGVSIGADGSSQMGLEDIALFRSMIGSVILYPCDAVSGAALTISAREINGISYLRMTREKTPVIYSSAEEFPIGGSKTLCQSVDDRVTIVTAGITVHEALKAYDELKEQGIPVRVIDAYSIKPIDVRTLKKAAADTHAFVIVEDHYAEGGLGDAVRVVLDGTATEVRHLAVRKVPRSGTTPELLAYAEIDTQAIVRAVREMIV